MSNASKYSGLAGTILLGTLLGLNYTQYARRKHPFSDKGAAYDSSQTVASGAFFDKDGNVVPLGKTNLPGMDSVRRYREYIPSSTILILCGVLSVMWTARSFSAMNKVLVSRYGDIVYQIRRPDVIANRLVAWKYLGLGGLLVPIICGTVGYYVWISGSTLQKSSEFETSIKSLSSNARRIGTLSPLNFEKGAFSSSVTEFTRTLKDGFRP